ncbi:MAG: glycosyltransferase [Desulfobulbaceae bacterium BRH_c16a]|nr:MAG: glycosyltransferase [Desulfobulbaceae bacterium BRH_c16a]
MKTLNIVIFGLSITSSWGNGHATTFRSLAKALSRRGHRIAFFEKDVPWYAGNRDLAEPLFCRTILYRSIDELRHHEETIGQADLVILGSYVADAEKLSEMIKRLNPPCFVFYDIDTPVTLAKLDRGDFEYLHPRMIPEFDMYWSFTGGPILTKLEREYGAKRALPLYCSVDPDLYHPDLGGPCAGKSRRHTISLGYLGTYSDDRQPTLEELLITSARLTPHARFWVAGAQYPQTLQWPDNVEMISHVPPCQHRSFYNSQRFTLNITRRDMIDAGFSPSVRLFEAGACGTPVITDFWTGLDSFFRLGEEILVARTSRDVLDYLEMGDEERLEIAARFREKVLGTHTSGHRALQVEQYMKEASGHTPATNRLDAAV